MTEPVVKSKPLSPMSMFSQDLMADPDLAPQLSDPDRVAVIEVYAKGAFPDRAPDIGTPRTDVSIVGWEDKDPNDPFWQD